MKINITKLDRRYNGHRYFVYRINPVRQLGLYKAHIDFIYSFYSIRNFCWETWGPSVELDYFSCLIEEWPDLNWSWESDGKKNFIYLKSDKELAWLQLKFS